VQRTTVQLNRRLELYHEYATKQGYRGKQRTQIADEAVDRIKRHDWENLEELDPEYCCSEKRKADQKIQIA